MKCYSSNITSSLHTLKLGGILKVGWKLERFGILSASLCLQSDWVMHSSDHQTVTQHAEMEERTIMKAMLLLVSNNYYNLFIIRIKRVYGNIYDGPQNPLNHIVIRLFDGWFLGHEIDCLATVNEKQFLSDLIEFGKAVIVKKINKAHNIIIWRSCRNRNKTWI